MNKMVLLLVLFLFSIINTKAESNMTIVVGNKVNIRDYPDLNSKIIDQCNFGNEVYIHQISRDEYPIKNTDYPLGNQSKLFQKVTVNKKTGWINCLLISNNFINNKTDNYYVYTVTLNIEGLDNTYSLNCYNTTTKKYDSLTVIAYNVLFSSNGKYAVSYLGESFNSIDIYILPSLKKVFSEKDVSEIQIVNNEIIFYKLVSKIKNPDPIKTPDLNYYNVEKYIYKGGKIFKTGEISVYTAN